MFSGAAAAVAHKPSYRPLLVLALSAAFAPISNAQWLQHTVVTTGLSTTAVFPGGAGPYAGTVTTSVSNIFDGLGNGVPGIGAVPFTNLTPTLLANFPLNSNGAFEYMPVSFSDNGDSYDVTMNFTGLGSGYLPAGSVIALLDIDISEQMLGFKAFGPGNVQITTSWLTPLAAPRDVFDWSNSLGDGINPAFAASVSESGGVYDLLGMNINLDSAFQGFSSTENIESMTWHFTFPNPGPFNAGTGGYAVAIGSPVPEPSSATLAIIGGLAGLIGYRRKSRKQADC